MRHINTSNTSHESFGWHWTIIKTSNKTRADEAKNGGIHMISRLIIAVAVALFFTPAAPIFAQEHPEHPKKSGEHPKEHPQKEAEAKQVSTADISAGIKKNIE